MITTSHKIVFYLDGKFVVPSSFCFGLVEYTLSHPFPTNNIYNGKQFEEDMLSFEPLMLPSDTPKEVIDYITEYLEWCYRAYDW